MPKKDLDYIWTPSGGSWDITAPTSGASGEGGAQSDQVPVKSDEGLEVVSRAREGECPREGPIQCTNSRPIFRVRTQPGLLAFCWRQRKLEPIVSRTTLRYWQDLDLEKRELRSSASISTWHTPCEQVHSKSQIQKQWQPFQCGGRSDSGEKSGISGGGLAGIVIPVSVVGAVAVIFIINKKRRKSSLDIEKLEVQPFVPYSQEVQASFVTWSSYFFGDMKLKQTSSATSMEDTETPTAMPLKPPPINPQIL